MPLTLRKATWKSGVEDASWQNNAMWAQRGGPSSRANGARGAWRKSRQCTNNASGAMARKSWEALASERKGTLRASRAKSTTEHGGTVWSVLVQLHRAPQPSHPAHDRRHPPNLLPSKPAMESKRRRFVGERADEVRIAITGYLRNDLCVHRPDASASARASPHPTSPINRQESLLMPSQSSPACNAVGGQTQSMHRGAKHRPPNA